MSRDGSESSTPWTPRPEAFPELLCQSNFSFLEGASHPEELVHQAADLGYPAIGIADRNTVAGVVRAHEAARQRGIPLVVGSLLHLGDGSRLACWAGDRAAWASLCRLLTLGKGRTSKGECSLDSGDLAGLSQGVWAGLVLGEGQDFDSRAQRLKSILGDHLSLVVDLPLGPDDSRVAQEARDRSFRLGIPLLASCRPLYHVPSRRPLQDVLRCIRLGCVLDEAGYRLEPNAQRCLHDPLEWSCRLRGLHLEAAMDRAREVAANCRFSLEELRYEYPSEVCPGGIEPMVYLEDIVWRKAKEKYPGGIPPKVRGLIGHELELIRELHYESYFLTVYDLVVFARSRGINCQGRGSAANSAVCYVLGITCVDPSRIDLLFERFVSRARNEPPDIDIDFEHQRREEVIQYVYEKYGRRRTAMTCEVICFRRRSAIREVSKVLAMNLSAESLDKNKPDEDSPAMKRMLDLAEQIRGFPRHLGQHVGGMIMTRGDLCDLVPIENARMENRSIIEWNKDDIDTLGILKVDLLGLGMLSCIRRTFELLGSHGVRLSREAPADDPAVYDMISRADTVGVFQIESRAQMAMLPRLKPRNFYDLVIEVAIVRPGPIQGDMVHPYLRRRDGLEAVSYPTPELREVLEKTLGVPLFQEQAMRIAMVAGGFSAEEADRLRKAMAAWKRGGSVDVFQQRFISGMLSRGYEPEFAQRCFNQIRGFSEYGFPESHAASFAVLVYQSAWLKHYYPAAFAAALVNSQPIGFYAPAQIIQDAARHGVIVRAVSVNDSHWDCTLEPGEASHAGHALRLGLALIHGFRREAADRLVEERVAGGPYGSIEALRARTRLGRAAVELLARADAFACLGSSRRQALWNSFRPGESEDSLFAGASGRAGLQELPIPTMTPWQEVAQDISTSGLSIKGHPLSFIRKTLAGRGVIAARDVAESPAGRQVTVGGLVLMRQRPSTANGILFVTLEDETGVVNLIVRQEIYESHRAIARYAGLMIAHGRIERKDSVVHVLCRKLEDASPLLGELTVPSRDFR